MAHQPIGVALHGGAGAKPGRDYRREIDHMRGLIEAARDRLSRGDRALDVACATTQALEASGLYVAGRGASPNVEGVYELDASLMDGAAGRAGAVAALSGFESPILAARAVMEATPHVLLVGAGAAAFAKRQGLAAIGDPATWFTPAGVDESNHAPGAGPTRTGAEALQHGTVGCVTLDQSGALAAATSTGGVFNKLPGRVGDTPLIGAGTWADRTVAVSCTGQGEYFIRLSAASQIAWRMRFAGENLEASAQSVLSDISDLGGEGGLIGLSASGEVVMPYSSAGMKRAALLPDGAIAAAAFAF